MRKRNIEFFFDTVMWYLLYLLPIVIFLVALSSMTLEDLCAFISASDVSKIGDTFVFAGLSAVFGADGVVPLFVGSTGVYLLYYATYFVIIWLLHLAVDFLVFIPRLCHKWLHYFTREDK